VHCSLDALLRSQNRTRFVRRRQLSSKLAAQLVAQLILESHGRARLNNLPANVQRASGDRTQRFIHSCEESARGACEKRFLASCV
jgi:hypothetical protein